MKMTKKEQRESLQRNEAKWSEDLMAAGWTVLPSVILERQKGLGLDALDLNILLHLASYWWYSDNPPHPSKRAIAERMNVNVSTIRKRIARMEADGLIRRQARFKPKGGQDTNFYHFDGLIKEATPYAQEVVEVRRRRNAEDGDRRRRRRPKPPKLSLVPSPTDTD